MSLSLDGHHVWEMEAKTDKELCKPVSASFLKSFIYEM